MKKTNVMIWAALAALLVPALGAAEVAYGGSSTIAETVIQGGGIEGCQTRTGVKVRVADTSGTGKGLKALAEGKLDVVGAGRALSADEKKAGLLGTIIGYDGLAVYVNKANGVKDLSKSQLKDIFTGKVKSWKELGGKDVPIVPMIEPVASKRATVQLLQEQILDGAPFAPGIKEMEQLPDQMAEVARQEGGICIASIGFLGTAPAAVKSGVRAVNLDGVAASDNDIRSGAYLLSRPVLLATKGLPQGEVKKFIEFMLSSEGQVVVEKYFVRVKK
jgi:phosphate transport system substrate-binding protein